MTPAEAVASAVEAVVSAVEAVASAGEDVSAQEQPPSEVLPGEALVQQTLSTVALTLTPASGESSHQVIPNDPETISLGEPIAQSDLPAELELASQDTNGSELTQDKNHVPTPEVAQHIPEEVTSLSAAPESHDDVADPLPDSEEDVAPTTEDAAPTTEPEAVELQTSPDENGELSSQVDEPAAAVVLDEASNVPTTTDTEATKTTSKANKDSFSCNVKRNKSKKLKADLSTQVTEAGQPVSPKPRKSHPLAGKFRSVIEQVKSKVKKDKEAAAASIAAASTAAAAVEPTPIAPDVTASA